MPVAIWNIVQVFFLMENLPVIDPERVPLAFRELQATFQSVAVKKITAFLYRYKTTAPVLLRGCP